MPLIPLKNLINYLADCKYLFCYTKVTVATNNATITAQIRAFIPEPFIRFPFPVTISAINITAISAPTGRRRLIALEEWKARYCCGSIWIFFLWTGSSSSPVAACSGLCFCHWSKIFCVKARTSTRTIARIQVEVHKQRLEQNGIDWSSGTPPVTR